MIDRYVVDFHKTFGSAMLLGVEPKMTRADRTNPNSPTEQAKDKDGVLKWTVTLAVETASFGNKKYENIPITMTSPSKPLGTVPPGTPMAVEGLELGIMPQARGGFSVFYAADTIRPLQPVRATSGQ